jgi:hypothetical protein
MDPNRQLSLHIIISALLSTLFWVMSAWFIPPAIAPAGYTTYTLVFSGAGVARITLSLMAILLIVVSADAYPLRRPKVPLQAAICVAGALFLGLFAAFGFMVKPIEPANEVLGQAFSYGLAPTTLIVGFFITYISIAVGLGDRA